MSPLRADAVEIDELCVSRKHNLWLWTAVSRYSGQLLAFFIGDRSEKSLAELWARVPERWRRRLVYTDGYAWLRGVRRVLFALATPPV